MFIHGNGRKDVAVSGKIVYADAYEKAVKACRDLDLQLGLMSKDAGQVQCSQDSSLIGANYYIDVFLEKDQGLLKRVDVKSYGWVAYGMPPSDATANEFAAKYLDALKRLGVE